MSPSLVSRYPNRKSSQEKKYLITSPSSSTSASTEGRLVVNQLKNSPEIFIQSNESIGGPPNLLLSICDWLHMGCCSQSLLGRVGTWVMVSLGQERGQWHLSALSMLKRLALTYVYQECEQV